jgi:hypothetical protein
VSRTLEDMYKDLKLAKEETEPIRGMLLKANDKEYKIRKEIERYKLDNGMYSPISELSNHPEEIIDFIDLVELNEDGTLSVEYMYNDISFTKRFMVNKNGHIYYFDSVKSLNYNEKLRRYILRFHDDGREVEHNYIGFLLVEFTGEKHESADKLFEKIFGKEHIK